MLERVGQSFPGDTKHFILQGWPESAWNALFLDAELHVSLAVQTVANQHD